MSAFIDITGHRFTRWHVEGMWDGDEKRSHWRCRCDCGTIRRVNGLNLRQGKTLSCGCLCVERTTKHGMVDHEAYSSWKAMRNRCRNPSHWEYPNYGGRGILVCERWADFTVFWHDMGPSWKPNMSIDRIDGNGNYEPSNCRWATSKEQGRNRRDNVMINTPNGKMTISEASETFGIKRVTLDHRVRAGLPMDKLFLPARRHSYWNNVAKEK